MFEDMEHVSRLDWSAPFRLTFRAGRVLGVPLRLHASALLLPLVAFPLVYVSSGDFVLAALLIPASVISLLLHELGHALVARRYQVTTVDLTLYALGGVLRVAGPMPPRVEWRVAVAGPMVNGLLAALGLAALALSGNLNAVLDPDEFAVGIQTLVGISWLNIVLFLFNLVPLYPMDGGRVLRSRLAGRLGGPRALRIASVSGQVFGTIVLILAPFLGSIWLAMMALTLVVAARREARVERLTSKPAVPDSLQTGALYSVEVPAQATLLEASMLLEERGADTLLVASGPGKPPSAVSLRELSSAMRVRGPEARLEEVLAAEAQVAR